MVRQTMYLFSRINFGKYRRNPMDLREVIDTADGRSWVRWLMSNSYNFTFDKAVVEYLEQKEQEYAGQLLQPVRGQ